MNAKLQLKYSITQLICLGAISLGLATPKSIFFGIIATFGFIGFIISNGYKITNTKLYKNLPQKNIIGITSIILSIIILHSAVYFTYKSTPLTIFITFLAIFIIILLTTKKYRQTPIFNLQSSIFNLKSLTSNLKPIDTLLLPILATQIALLYKIFTKATTIALGSPWPLFGNKFFIIYGICLLLIFLFFLHQRQNNIAKAIITAIHLFITFSIVTIVYKLGFGYDPFLHRAAESVIYNQGFIPPKTPFYIGQYVSINILTHITNIPLKIIDIWLVPILSSILLPLATFFGMKHGFKLSGRWSFFGAILITIYPLQTFIATTPNNLANLVLLIFILLTPIFFHHKNIWPLLLLIAITATTIHPLTGIFALWFLLGLLINKKPYNLLRLTPYALLGSILTPLLFLVYLKLQNIDPKSLSIIIDNIKNFTSLFQRPYYYINRPNAHWILDFIYTYQILIPFLITIAAILGYKKLAKNKTIRLTPYALYLMFPLIILANAFLLSTYLTFPNLDNFEQLQYAERLRHISIFPLLPLTLYGIISLLKKLTNKNISLPTKVGTIIYHLSFIIIFCTSSLLLTTSLYLTYPQRNAKTHFPGYNVTQSDIKAVQFIHEHSEKKYIVLANILTAAAAIDQYGFETYFKTPEGSQFQYSTPSGSPLAILYRKMLYEGQKESFMKEALKLTNTDRAYFVVNRYWHDFDNIINGAKKTAKDWQVIDNGEVWIFWYDKK